MRLPRWCHDFRFWLNINQVVTCMQNYSFIFSSRWSTGQNNCGTAWRWGKYFAKSVYFTTLHKRAKPKYCRKVISFDSKKVKKLTRHKKTYQVSTIYMSEVRTIKSCTFNLGLASFKYKNPYWTYITVEHLIIGIKCFHKRFKLFIICTEFICLLEIWIKWSQKELAKPLSQIPNIYFRNGNIKYKGQSF